MCSQRPSSSCASKVRAPPVSTVSVVSRGAQHPPAAGGEHIVVGRPGPDRLVRQVVQVLELGIAQHQPIAGVPQHERFGNGLDGVAQAQIGGERLLHQVLLFGGVDGDADEMHAVAVGGPEDLAAHAQPDPVAMGMAHAEGAIDRRRLAVGDERGNLVELDVVGMNEGRRLRRRS